MHIYKKMHNFVTRLLESVWKKSNRKLLFYLRYNLLVFGSKTKLFLDFACLSIYRIDICPELFVCLSIYKKAETCPHTHAHAHAHTYTHTNHIRYTPSVVLIYSPAQSHRFSKSLARNQSRVLRVYTYYHKISNFS